MTDDDVNYVPGYGTGGAEIVICGEAPSFEEISAGIPFVGASGRELDKLLREAGINRQDCWITNVCKYFVPPNVGEQKIPFMTRAQSVGVNMETQLQELQVELNEIKPNVIIALGGTALWGLCGKSKISAWRGSILQGMSYKVVGTYHPAHLLHSAKGGEVTDYWQRPVTVLDLKRAKYQSGFKEIIRPVRSLNVCRNSAQLADFIQRFKGYKRLSIDIEARECIPICVGLAFTRYESLTVPLWNIDGISSIPDNDLISCLILLAQVLAENDIVGQNFGYDRDKIQRLGFIIKCLISDVMLKSFCINPELPKNLAFNTSIYTEEPYYKDEGMYEGSVQDLFEGCGRDACVTLEIDEKMEPELDEIGQREFFYNFIMQLHDLYRHIEGQGFKVDEIKREELIHKYAEWSERDAYELYKIAEAEINVNSPKQVAVFLYEALGIPRRAGTGEEVLTQLLNNAVKKPEQRRAIELILEKRRIDKTLSNTVTAPTDYDGRMKTSYFVCLETGRTSTTQLEPPIRPWVEFRDDKNKLKKKAIGVAFQTITKHGDIGADVRSMFIADEGEIFIQADSSQAEARVVLLLADDEASLELIDTHDFHALTASWFFGGREEDYSKKVLGYESPIRFAGKTLRHAGHLGASKRRAAIEINTQARKYKIDFSISEKDSEIALNIFHKKTPNIQQVFHKGVIDALDKNRTLFAGLPYGIESPIGGRRQFFERWNDELFRQSFSYIPQRSVSDNTKAAALRIRKRIPNIRILLEAHDALLFSVPIPKIDGYSLIIKEEMEREIDFSKCSLPRRKLKIPCELEYGFNYKELGKFKDVKFPVNEMVK